MKPYIFYKYFLITVVLLVLIMNVFSQTKDIEIKLVEAGCNAYLICSENGVVLIDAGSHHKLKAFEKALLQYKIEWTSIKYIVITHTHYDHVANLAEIKKRSGAQIIIHNSESEYIVSGNTTLPDGMTCMGKAGIFYTKNFAKRNVYVPKITPDILIEESYTIPEFSYKIVHNPGHSCGSVSIILNDSICFCGDAAFKVFGNNLMPITGDNKTEIVKSWKKLLDLGCNYFYPGHGKPFTREELQKSFNRYSE